MSYTSEHPVWTATCAVCDGPVNLKTCKVDERGRPVHEECVKKPSQAAHRVVQLPSFLGHYRIQNQQ
jgi:hypothetical protein